jgi:hypothetical protein
VRLFHAGACEPFKQAYHEAIRVLAAGALGYSVGALLVRRTLRWHLVCNVAFYSVVLYIEGRQVAHHRGAGDAAHLLPSR